MFLQKIRQTWSRLCTSDQIFLEAFVLGVMVIGGWVMFYASNGLLAGAAGILSLGLVLGGVRSFYQAYRDLDGGRQQAALLFVEPPVLPLPGLDKQALSEHRIRRYHFVLQKRAKALLRVLCLDPESLKGVPALRLGLFLEGYFPGEGEEIEAQEWNRCTHIAQGGAPLGRGYLRNGILRCLQELLYAEGTFYSLRKLHRWVEGFLMPETRLEALNWYQPQRREWVLAEERERLLGVAGFRKAPGRLSPVVERRARWLWEQKEKNEAENALQCSVLCSLPWEPVRAGKGENLYDRRVLLEEFLRGEQQLPLRDGVFEDKTPPYLLKVEDGIAENAYQRVIKQVQRAEVREEQLLDPEERNELNNVNREEARELLNSLMALREAQQLNQRMDAQEQKLDRLQQEFCQREKREREERQSNKYRFAQLEQRARKTIMLQTVHAQVYGRANAAFLPQYQRGPAQNNVSSAVGLREALQSAVSMDGIVSPASNNAPSF